jgi:IS1 family transposase
MPLHTVEEAEVDEMWSLVGKNTHQRGLWPAMAHRTGVVVASVWGTQQDAVC